MSAAKHTPGPWKAYQSYPEVIEFSTPGHGDFGGMRVTVNGYNYQTGFAVDEAEQAANMALIAAAPDPLEALDRLASAAERREYPMGDPCALLAAKANLQGAVVIARSAIAKATGATS